MAAPKVPAQGPPPDARWRGREKLGVKLLFCGVDIREFWYQALPIAFASRVKVSKFIQAEMDKIEKSRPDVRLRNANWIGANGTLLALSRLFGQSEYRTRKFHCRSGESIAR